MQTITIMAAWHEHELKPNTQRLESNTNRRSKRKRGKRQMVNEEKGKGGKGESNTVNRSKRKRVKGKREKRKKAKGKITRLAEVCKGKKEKGKRGKGKRGWGKGENNMDSRSKRQREKGKWERRKKAKGKRGK